MNSWGQVVKKKGIANVTFQNTSLQGGTLRTVVLVTIIAVLNTAALMSITRSPARLDASKVFSMAWVSSVKPEADSVSRTPIAETINPATLRIVRRSVFVTKCSRKMTIKM